MKTNVAVGVVASHWGLQNENIQQTEFKFTVHRTCFTLVDPTEMRNNSTFHIASTIFSHSFHAVQCEWLKSVTSTNAQTVSSMFIRVGCSDTILI